MGKKSTIKVAIEESEAEIKNLEGKLAAEIGFCDRLKGLERQQQRKLQKKEEGAGK